MELSSGVVKSLLDVFVTKNIEDDEFEKILKAIVTNLTDSQSEILDEGKCNLFINILICKSSLYQHLSSRNFLLKQNKIIENKYDHC